MRATGGNNAGRYLIVRDFNTNIDHSVNFAVIPDDTIADRLVMEAHYYDPYNFTLNTSSNITTRPGTEETWANEERCDSQMAKMKTNFTGYTIVIRHNSGKIMGAVTFQFSSGMEIPPLLFLSHFFIMGISKNHLLEIDGIFRCSSKNK
ncbi:MAG: cellulase family glycosylhydrolase [Spirochaetales bacterium]|nr:cellulase family glycosylhydrolase [Spirochaetales bacterium]